MEQMSHTPSALADGVEGGRGGQLLGLVGEEWQPLTDGVHVGGGHSLWP